jgi:hypothetical protein
MYGTYESTQFIEVCTDKDNDVWEEHEFTITVECTSKSDPGCMYLRNGDPGYPPEGPEFELESITYHDHEGKPGAVRPVDRVISYDEMWDLVGDRQLVDDALESALIAAYESGEF